MKHIKLFKTEAEYETGVTALPCVSYVESTNEVHFDEKHAVDRIYNAPLMNMCVANGWAKESNDYLTYEEAAIISTINTQDFATYEVVSAWELKYFTGLTSINFNKVMVPTLKELYIPDTYTGQYAPAVVIDNINTAWAPNLVKLHIGDVVTNLGNCYAELSSTREGFDNSIIYIGENSRLVGAGPNPVFKMFKTAIIKGTARGSADMNTSDIQQITFFVEDDQVEAFQALIPFKKLPSTIHPLSEYAGDTDY